VAETPAARRVADRVAAPATTRHGRASVLTVLLGAIRHTPREAGRRSSRLGRPVPGDRVQLDTCKIKSGLYRYTAIGDRSRRQVLGLHPRRTAANTLAT
jgi:hypothetical protein